MGYFGVLNAKPRRYWDPARCKEKFRVLSGYFLGYWSLFSGQFQSLDVAFAVRTVLEVDEGVFL